MQGALTLAVLGLQLVTTALLGIVAWLGKRYAARTDLAIKRTDYLLGVRDVGDNDGAFGELEAQLQQARVAREEDHRELEAWLTDLDDRLDRLEADVGAIRTTMNHTTGEDPLGPWADDDTGDADI